MVWNVRCSCSEMKNSMSRKKPTSSSVLSTGPSFRLVSEIENWSSWRLQVVRRRLLGVPSSLRSHVIDTRQANGRQVSDLRWTHHSSQSAVNVGRVRHAHYRWFRHGHNCRRRCFCLFLVRISVWNAPHAQMHSRTNFSRKVRSQKCNTKNPADHPNIKSAFLCLFLIHTL